MKLITEELHIFLCKKLRKNYEICTATKAIKRLNYAQCKVILMGNITRDPELKELPSGSKVCDFGLAVNRTYTTQSGEQRDETTFVDISCFARGGEVIH